MNRHHPYASAYEGGGSRRGGPTSGPGPDRPHRFSDRGGHRGRGRGRGGGGGGIYNSGNYSGGGPPYEQNSGPHGYDSSTPDAYNQWNNSQAPYFGQNAGHSNNFSPYDEPSTGYEQTYGNYEDDSYSGNRRGGYGGGPRGGRGRGGPPRHGREEKVPDSVIEERIQRERPCRTLFIRNIKYETDSNEVRRQFGEHGEIKTFFDLISNRGMVFVTYFDLRSAERARERLQNTEISGRPIDVHYSLPRADDNKDGRDRNQGVLMVTLQNSSQSIDEGELRRRLQSFGDVKSVRPGDNPHNQRYVEYYDLRACEDAYERLRGQGFQDGLLDLIFAPDYDGPSPANGPPPSRRQDDRRNPVGGAGGPHGGRQFDDRGDRGGRGRRGGPGPQRGGRGGGPRDDWDRRDDWGRDRDREKRFDDDFNRGARGRSGPPGPGSRFDARGPPPAPPPPTAAPVNYNQPPPMSGPPSYPQQNGGPPPPTNDDDRLEQARKVQQLLAALKQPQTGASAPPAPATSAVPPVPPPSMPPGAPSIPGVPYYPPSQAMPSVQAPYPGIPPAAPSYPGIPAPPPSQPTAPPAAALANLPPNVLAMLQQAQAAAPVQYSAPPALPAAAPGSDYSQLMAYLQSQAGKI